MSALPILCVDDDEHVRRFIARVLDSAGHECVPAAFDPDVVDSFLGLGA
jgi:CheY-like chemotaxis protein